MIANFGLMLPEWSKLAENPVMLVVAIFVLIGAAAVGAFVVGFGVRFVTMLVWRDISRAALFRIRILGGLTCALVVYSYLGWGGWGLGPGGPGDGNNGGANTGQANLLATTPAPDPGAAARPEAATGLKEERFQVVLLGPKTTPPAMEPDHFLKIASDTNPRALNNDEVMKIVLQLKGQNLVKAVELVINSESNMDGMSQVDSLRERVLKEAQLPFVQPDPQDPLGNKREVFTPANKKE